MQSRGFFELYSIDVRRQDKHAGSDRGRGLKSPYGRRGAICAHFGWTYDYLVNSIAWSVVQRMMIDAPNYDVEDEDEIVLTEQNSSDIIDYVNSLM
ncbi:hypothetical protein CLI79_03465 [Porphyromonas gingivalis]|nr:hypothetical protein CLI83_06190 [Porphyromonas gingivalis]PDP75543.1 hypothetical protein CLI79_03465 [Porphyromonas gingivalis]